MYVALFVLAVLEIVAGLLAGSAALASLVTEALARTTSAGARAFARRAGARPMTLRLRADLAAVLSTAVPEGGSR